MTQDVSPDRPLEQFKFINTETGRLTNYGLQILEQMWRQVACNFGPVPCDCENVGNLYTLTPRLNAEGARTYADGLGFWMNSPFTSTGDVTAKVVSSQGAALATLKVFKSDGAAQATTGDIIINCSYIFYYSAIADVGAGGFIMK